ncbi:hypothetical protein, partial [Lactococcus petauri]|uniref:hypothetical protein n=1 Tax=Lactococcus petauri TaxID=1940789 RepID=UPI0021F130CB
MLELLRRVRYRRPGWSLSRDCQPLFFSQFYPAVARESRRIFFCLVVLYEPDFVFADKKVVVQADG